MDEVNHVKMVASFVLFCCDGLFGLSLCLHNGYECSINVLIGEKIGKILFCRRLECFIALKVSGVHYSLQCSVCPDSFSL